MHLCVRAVAAVEPMRHASRAAASNIALHVVATELPGHSITNVELSHLHRRCTIGPENSARKDVIIRSWKFKNGTAMVCIPCAAAMLRMNADHRHKQQQNNGQQRRNTFPASTYVVLILLADLRTQLMVVAVNNAEITQRGKGNWR
jgi:hypothetical protein